MADDPVSAKRPRSPGLCTIADQTVRGREARSRRGLPDIRPTGFNDPVALRGRWHGNAYRFIQRWRSDGETAIAPEFEPPFDRLAYRGPDRFDLDWFRHAGQWGPMRQGCSLAAALAEIEQEPLLQPIPRA